MVEARRSLAALSEEFVEVSLRLDPVAATEAGVHDYDGRFPDPSPDGIAERAGWLADFDARLAAAAPQDPAQEIERDLMRARIAGMRIDLEQVKVHARNPAHTVEVALHGLFLLLARPFAPLEDRKESILERLMAVPDYLHDARASLGPVAPPVAALASEIAVTGPGFVDEIVRTLRHHFAGEAERIEFAGQRARLGFVRFQEEIERSGATGAGFAIGEVAMNDKLRREHLLDLDCGALEELGREHLERARAALVAEARRVDPARDWRELIARGRDELPDPVHLRETYAAEAQRARAFVLERGIAPLPDGPLEVVATPPFARAMVPVAALVPAAPLDSDSTAVFFVTPVDPGRPEPVQREQLEAHALPGLPIVVVHEAYPGHHQQFLVTNRAGSRLRRVGWSTLFCEGWAFYCEELMADLGFYPHPLSRLFQLQDVLFRACRVVIDVGLHTGRMSVEEAQAFFQEHAFIGSPTAEAEVKYDIVNPTQPMSYLVGKLAFEELREESRRRLGDRFHLPEFHAALLAGGALPPALVRREIGRRLATAPA